MAGERALMSGCGSTGREAASVAGQGGVQIGVQFERNWGIPRGTERL